MAQAGSSEVGPYRGPVDIIRRVRGWRRTRFYSSRDANIWGGADRRRRLPRGREARVLPGHPLTCVAQVNPARMDRTEPVAYHQQIRVPGSQIAGLGDWDRRRIWCPSRVHPFVGIGACFRGVSQAQEAVVLEEPVDSGFVLIVVVQEPAGGGRIAIGVDSDGGCEKRAAAAADFGDCGVVCDRWRSFTAAMGQRRRRGGAAAFWRRGRDWDGDGDGDDAAYLGNSPMKAPRMGAATGTTADCACACGSAIRLFCRLLTSDWTAPCRRPGNRQARLASIEC